MGEFSLRINKNQKEWTLQRVKVGKTYMLVYVIQKKNGISFCWGLAKLPLTTLDRYDKGQNIMIFNANFIKDNDASSVGIIKTPSL